ncbi:MAG: sulfatase-like hydrolase/transferase [Bacteroidota bacterium]
METPDQNSSAERTMDALRTFVSLSIVMTLFVLISRPFEMYLVSLKHGSSIHYGPAVLNMLMSDLLFFFTYSGIVLLLFVPLFFYSEKAARWMYYSLALITGIVQFGLLKYFSITLIPLGADFFGYSASDIKFTVASSTSNSFVSVILPYGTLFAVIGLHYFFGKRLTVRNWFAGGFAALSILSIIISLFAFPSPKDFSTEQKFNLAVNKTHYFAAKAFRYFIEPSVSTENISEEYPLLRDFPYNDVLSPFFDSSSAAPNIVVIIAEGMGRDFVGEGARYGGFVPFLDSLSKRSLYWENFLSNSGRTFGVLPSLLGSLPYGDKGFNELEYRMPRHLSLIRLLNQNNYRVNFMYGGNKNFDKKDVFLEREQVSLILDESKYGPDFLKATGDAGGFSWGYPDGEVFRKAIETLAEQRSASRLDIYLTMSTHEPFLPPNRPYYLRLFDATLRGLPVSPEQRTTMTAYRDQFASLLYFNDAIRYLFTEYAKRPDYKNTIFILTGDHRIIPIPSATKIDRFHVPLMIFSPMLKAPVKFSSVSSHLDVTPTILAFLKHRHGLRVPEKAHWLGDGIDTVRNFRNIHSIPFMRVKEEIADYLDGDLYISGEQLFELRPGMDIAEIQDEKKFNEVSAKLEHFKEINKYVVDENKLFPKTEELMDDDVTPEDIIAFQRIDSLGLDLEKLFFLARQKAFNKEIDESRLICRRILFASPNFHDTRVLLGRTYAWNNDYRTAKRLFNDVISRDETYIDAYSALADAELWSDSAAVSLEVAKRGLGLYPKNEDLLARSVKALVSLNRKKEAEAELKKLKNLNPNNPDLTVLTRRVSSL